MSESQKKMAKRIIEILIEIGFLNKIDDEIGRKTGDQYEAGYSKEAWVRELTQAIAMYQAEELEKAMAEYKRECSRCGRGK